MKEIFLYMASLFRTVTMRCSTPGAQIRYTMSSIYAYPPDDPTEESKLYESPFEISVSPMDGYYIKARAYKDGMIVSDIAENYLEA